MRVAFIMKGKIDGKMGKSKYETHVVPYFDDIFYWYSHDWTLERIASELGIAKSTMMLYKKDESDLSDLLKKAEKAKPRYIAIKAEAALRDKLSSREVEEVHQEQWVDKNGNVTKKHIKKIKKVILADTTAIIFALKNTDPKRWNERSQVELTGSVKTNPFANLTEDELRKIAEL